MAATSNQVLRRPVFRMPRSSSVRSTAIGLPEISRSSATPATRSGWAVGSIAVRAPGFATHCSSCESAPGIPPTPTSRISSGNTTLRRTRASSVASMRRAKNSEASVFTERVELVMRAP
jgi:hypothetical protein